MQKNIIFSHVVLLKNKSRTQNIPNKSIDFKKSTGLFELIISIILSLTAIPSFAGTLTNVIATASNTTAGATGVTYTLSFTTANTLARGENFLITFPATLVLPGFGSFIAPATSCDGNISISINGVPQTEATVINNSNCGTFANNRMQINLAQPIPAGSAVVLTIPNGTNPIPFPTSAFTRLDTAQSNGTPIDAPAVLPALTAAAPAAVAATPLPTLGDWTTGTIFAAIAAISVVSLRKIGVLVIRKPSGTPS